MRSQILKPVYELSKKIASSRNMGARIAYSDKLLREMQKAREGLQRLGISPKEASSWAMGMSQRATADVEGRTVDIPIKGFNTVYMGIFK